MIELYPLSFLAHVLGNAVAFITTHFQTFPYEGTLLGSWLWIQTVVLCGSLQYMTCVCDCEWVCIWMRGSMTGWASKSRCNNRGGGREHKGGQVQQPQVTWDHRLASIPRLSMLNHPWLVIGTSCPILKYWCFLPICIIMYPNPSHCRTHHFVVPPPAIEVNRSVSAML